MPTHPCRRSSSSRTTPARAPTLCSRAAAKASRSSRWRTGGCSRSSSWIGVTPEPLEPAVGAHEVGDEVVGRRPEDRRRGVVLLEVTALPQHRDPVAEPHGLLDVVGHEDDGLVQLGLQPQELALQPLARDRVDGAERLVHEQHRRVGGQGPCDPDPLALAAGELVRVARGVRRWVEADQLEQLADAGLALVLRPAEQVRDGGDVLRDGLVREQPDLLDDVADAAAHLHRVPVGDVTAVDEDPPAGGLDEPVDHAHGRGLAAARRSHQHAQLAGGDVQGQLGHRHRPVRVGLADPVQPDHRVVGDAQPGCGRGVRRWREVRFHG